jgi:hypothetical protein
VLLTEVDARETAISQRLTTASTDVVPLKNDQVTGLRHLLQVSFAANAAWAVCAMITHNLLRAAGSVSNDRHAVARGATLRRHLVTVPARLPDHNAVRCYTSRRTGHGPPAG